MRNTADIGMLGLCSTATKEETMDRRGRMEVNSFKRYKGKEIEFRLAGRGPEQDSPEGPLSRGFRCLEGNSGHRENDMISTP